MAESQELSEHLLELIAERERILRWLNPPEPDETKWPPEGYKVHPDNPALLYRVISSEELRKEIFGDPEREEGERIAKNRIEEIEAELRPVFFPNPKEEGMQRKKAFGFSATLKTGLKREIDETALYSVLEGCPKTTEAKVVSWKASLKLKEYRELSEKTRQVFDNALIITPDKPKFELSRVTQKQAE